MTVVFHEFGAFRFVPAARELWRAGQRVPLPRRTFECLEYLLAQRDRAVGRDELVAAVFRRHNVSDAQLGQVVLRARRAVDDDGNNQRVIRTIPGFGYRWIAAVRTLDGMPSARDDAQTAATALAAQRVEAAPIDATPIAVAPIATAPIETKRFKAAPIEAARVTGTHASRPSRRQSLAVPSIAALSVAVLALVAAIAFVAHSRIAATDMDRLHAAPVIARDSVVVLPLRVDGLAEDAWVRLGLMDLVADRLRDTGLVVPPSENVLTLIRTRADDSDDAEKDRFRRVRAATAARLIISGTAKRSVAGWNIALRASPEHGIAVPAQFTDRDPLTAARGAVDLLLAALGHAAPSETEKESAVADTLQRVRAAMLANELDTARAILTTSPALARTPAQLDYRLAQVDFRAGALDRAEATFDALLADAAIEHDPRFNAQVLNARGATRMRRGAFADAGHDYEAALALLGPDGDALDRGQALVGRGNSRVAAHRFSAALDDFAGARVALARAGDALGMARVDANLGMLELYRGRPAEAQGYLVGAADRFQAFGALHELLLTLTGIVDAQLSLLQRDSAWSTAERGWALRERISDPDQRIDLLLNRAQVQIGFGRYRDAAVALAEVRRGLPARNGVLTARARSLLADFAWRQQHWQEAADFAGSALAEWPPAGADADRASTTLLRQRALLALGHDQEAAALLDRARTPPANGDAPGAVADALAMAEWSARKRDATAASRWFDFASASAERRGVPAEIVAVALAWAPDLLAVGDVAKASALIGRVAPWAAHDFDCALLTLRLLHRLGPQEAWFDALRQAQTLAGERDIPSALAQPPPAGGAIRAAAGASR